MDRRMHGVIFGGAGELIPTFLNPDCKQAALARPTLLALGQWLKMKTACTSRPP